MIYLKYYLSVIIWQIFNPFGLYQSFLQNFGQVISILRSFFAKEIIINTPMSLPFSGKWKVFNGGVDRLNSHSWNIISQRFAYDFIISGERVKRSDSKRRTATDFLTFNENVYAPKDGIAVEVKNNINDNMRAGSGWIDIRTKDMRGNFIIIKHDKNVYSLLAHLKKGSCLIKKGDFVKRGQIIAKCGNSGHSTQPHVHFQVQDTANWYFSKGLPIIFTDIYKSNIDNGKTEYLKQTYIARNDTVSNANFNNLNGHGKTEINLSKDLKNPFVLSIINTFGILIGGAFIYYTVIKIIIRIMQLLIGKI